MEIRLGAPTTLRLMRSWHGLAGPLDRTTRVIQRGHDQQGKHQLSHQQGVDHRRNRGVAGESLPAAWADKTDGVLDLLRKTTRAPGAVAKAMRLLHTTGWL